jgi:hypothetical protein
MARTMRADTDPQNQQADEQPRRRGRPSKHPLPIGGNVSDETIEEFAQRALAARLELEAAQTKQKTANGVYRNVLKSAKAAGVDEDCIAWWIKERKREPEDINREIQWRNRIARIMGLPIGTQLGVDFETGETVASQVDQAQLSKGKRPRGRPRKAPAKAANTNGSADPKAAYIIGYDLGKAGKSPSRAADKFDGPAAVQFQAGWQQGQKDRGRELGPEGAATVQ